MRYGYSNVLLGKYFRISATPSSQLIERCFYYLIQLIVSIAEMDIFLVLLAILSILLVITFMLRERKIFPPGPPGIPLLGNVNDLKPETMLTTLR